MVAQVFESIHRINVDLVFGANGLAASANAAAKGFLERPEFKEVEWLCIIDNDTVPPRDVLRMLDDVPEYVDIISPLCHMQRDNYVFPQAGYYMNEHMEPVRVSLGSCTFYPIVVMNPPGLQEVDRVGGGCWFIRRRVFDKMEKPYFRLEHDPNTFEIIMTDDLYFQDQAQGLGFRQFCDTRFVAHHHHTFDMTTIQHTDVTNAYVEKLIQT
jgi:hypothetical protein